MLASPSASSGADGFLFPLKIREGPGWIVHGVELHIFPGGAQYEDFARNGVDVNRCSPAIDDHFALIENVGVLGNVGRLVVVFSSNEGGEDFVEGILTSVLALDEEEDVREVVVKQSRVVLSSRGLRGVVGEDAVADGFSARFNDWRLLFRGRLF